MLHVARFDVAGHAVIRLRGCHEFSATGQILDLAGEKAGIVGPAAKKLDPAHNTTRVIVVPDVGAGRTQNLANGAMPQAAICCHSPAVSR